MDDTIDRYPPYVTNSQQRNYLSDLVAAGLVDIGRVIHPDKIMTTHTHYSETNDNRQTLRGPRTVHNKKRIDQIWITQQETVTPINYNSTTSRHITDSDHDIVEVTIDIANFINNNFKGFTRNKRTTDNIRAITLDQNKATKDHWDQFHTMITDEFKAWNFETTLDDLLKVTEQQQSSQPIGLDIEIHRPTLNTIWNNIMDAIQISIAST